MWHAGHSSRFGKPSIYKFFRSSLRHSASSLLVSAASTSLPLLLFSFSSISLAVTVFSFFLYYQPTIGFRTLVFPGELARQRALLVLSAMPCSLSPLCLSSYHLLSGGVLSHPNFSTEEHVLPLHARCVLPRLRCNRNSLPLSSHFSRIGRVENPSCSAWGHPCQDTYYFTLHCPATNSLRRSLFGDSLLLYDLCSKPWVVARLLGLHSFPSCLHLPEG